MTLLAIIDNVNLNSFIYTDKNGIDWYTYLEGLIRYDQKLESKIDEHYKILMRSVTAGKEQLNPEFSATKSTEIKSSDNSLNFQYTAPFYEQEDKTQY